MVCDKSKNIIVKKWNLRPETVKKNPRFLNEKKKMKARLEDE